MKIIDCIQGTDEWYAARLGKVTASCFGKVLRRGKPKKTRDDYMLQLVSERLTGQVEESYTNKYMEWGSAYETEAIFYYQAMYGVEGFRPGFVEKTEFIGCSPDFLTDDGVLEVKCPKTSTHLRTIMENRVPPVYIPQVQGVLWVSERSWCDFVSYDPRMPSNRIHIVRVQRDEEYIKNLEKEVNYFVEELKEIIEKMEAPF